MTKTLKVLLCASFCWGLCYAGYAAGKAAGAKEFIQKFKEAKPIEVMPGVSKVPLWGDSTKAGYGAVTTFKAGTKLGMHSHSGGISLVVIDGEFIHSTPSGDVTLTKGDYLWEPAGVVHGSGCKAGGADCVFFETSATKFDVKMADASAKK